MALTSSREKGRRGSPRAAGQDGRCGGRRRSGPHPGIGGVEHRIPQQRHLPGSRCAPLDLVPHDIEGGGRGQHHDLVRLDQRARRSPHRQHGEGDVLQRAVGHDGQAQTAPGTLEAGREGAEQQARERGRLGLARLARGEPAVERGRCGLDLRRRREGCGDESVLSPARRPSSPSLPVRTRWRSVPSSSTRVRISSTAAASAASALRRPGSPADLRLQRLELAGQGRDLRRAGAIGLGEPHLHGAIAREQVSSTPWRRSTRDSANRPRSARPGRAPSIRVRAPAVPCA